MVPKLLIFDVNETLLDLGEMKARVNRVFQHDFAFDQWFLLMLQYFLVDTVTNNYHNFGDIGKAAWQMTETILGKKIPDEDAGETLRMIRRLSPHPDIKKGLAILKDSGYTMVALTNSTAEVLKQQMEHAGLTDYFELLLSIDEFKKYKPAPETYRAVVKKFNLQPEEAMMIAAHGWDVAGALRAGLQAAFIARKGKALYPLSLPPHITGKTLIDIAEKLSKIKLRTH